MKRIVLSLRMALAAVIIVVLVHTTLLLIGIVISGTRVHTVLSLLGIGAAIFAALMLIRDALRTRVRLNELDAMQFSPDPE
ncbi:MAG: hypothetical protein WA414_14630 [Acidobacteriaceae bacterium]